MPGRRLTPTCRRCAARKSWPELTARQGGIKSVCDCVYGKQLASVTVPGAVATGRHRKGFLRKRPVATAPGTVPLPVGKPRGQENEGQENIFRSHHPVENSLHAAFIPPR